MSVSNNTFKKWALGALALVFVGTLTALGTQNSSLLKGAYTPSYYLEVQVNTEDSTPITGLDATSFSAGSSTILSVTESGTTPGRYDLAFSYNTTSYTVTIQPSGYVSTTATGVTTALPILNATVSLNYGHHIIVGDSSRTAITGATVTMGSSIPTACIESSSYAGMYGCPYAISSTAADYNLAKDGYLSVTGTFYAARSSNSSAELNTTVIMTVGTDPSDSAANVSVRNASAAYVTGLTTTNFSNSCGLVITGATESSTRPGYYSLSFDQDNASCTVSAAVSGYVTGNTSTFAIDGPSGIKNGTVVLPYGHTITVKDSATSAAITGATITTTPSYTCAETTTSGTYGCIVPLSATIDYSVSKSAYTTGTGSFTTTRSSDSSAALTSSVNLAAIGYSVSITESESSTAVTEGSTADSYTLVLTSAPTADVTITATPNSQVTVSPSTLTFTSSNWATPQTITVSAVNDSVTEGTHYGSIAHTASSADTNYNASTIGSVTPTITDYTPGYNVTLTQTDGGTTVTEGWATDTYTAVLTSAPTYDVTLTLTADSQVTVSPSTLTFTSSNWATAQTLTVSAVVDSSTEGTHSGTIAHTVSSSDTNYNAITVSSLTVTVSEISTGDDCNGMPFTDVSADDWFCPYVYQLHDKGIVEGKSATLFSPNDQVTRAEAMKMITLLLLDNPTPSGVTPFLDVSSLNWYEDILIAAEEAGVARTEDDGGYFYGDLPCTRGWLAIYIGRALELESWDYEDYYSDVNHSDPWAYVLAILTEKTFDDPYDDSSSEIQVIEGYSDGTYGPNNNIARSEAAAAIYRAWQAYLNQ